MYMKLMPRKLMYIYIYVYGRVHIYTYVRNATKLRSRRHVVAPISRTGCQLMLP